MSNVCPQGHLSSDPGYCSECGLALKSNPTKDKPQAAGAASGAQCCPDCMSPRAPGARFCEVCRYNFMTGTPFSGLVEATAENSPQTLPAGPPAAAAPDNQLPASVGNALSAALSNTSGTLPEPSAPLATEQALPDIVPVPAPSPRLPQLQVRVTIDESLNTEPDPDQPCPQGVPAKVYHLDLKEMMVGRLGGAGAMQPEIAVGDGGVSRHHLKFVRGASVWLVLELGSANGTLLNGRPLVAHVETPIKAGDHLTLGMWTRIAVEAR